MSILKNIKNQNIMTMNLLQNFNTLDQNLLNYGLLFASVSIIGYSMYYFSSYFNTNNEKFINTLPDQTNVCERLYENLEYQNLGKSKLDLMIPKTSDIAEDTIPTMSNLVESAVNTDKNSLVDSAVQTDQKMLYDYMNELLYNNATPITSLGEISPTDFVRDYRNDPKLASYFNKTEEWVDSISRQSSGTSANSEVLFLRKVNEDIRSITELIQNNIYSSNPVSPIENLMPKVDQLVPYYPGVEGSVELQAEIARRLLENYGDVFMVVAPCGI